MKYLIAVLSMFLLFLAFDHYRGFGEDNTKIHIEVWCADKTRAKFNARGIPNFTDRIYIITEKGFTIRFRAKCVIIAIM